MGIPGEELNLDGVYYGLPFLTDIRCGEKIPLAGKAVVIGGGNVAFDTARTALRVGAQDVHIYYRRGVDEMPAWKKDIEEAVEEGVIIKPFWSPRRILHDNAKVTGIEFVGSRTVFEQDGTSYVKEDPEQLLKVDADAVLIAVGQAPDVSFISKESQLERSLWGSLEVDKNSLTTNVAGIFAGGDFITGPTTVISAIASGRRAAIAIDHYLSGIKGPVQIVDEKTQFFETAGLALESESTEEMPRIQIKVENPTLRSRDFREVEKGFTEEQARIEAARCLRCDLEER
jgi:NADH-quinone oxidoreductase subunit F